MSKLTDSQAVVIAAIIGVIGIIVGAILTPLVPKLIDSSESETRQSTLSIEQMPQRVFVYAGNDNPDGGWGAFSLNYDEMHTPIYKLEYALPNDRNSYAGIAFQFAEGQNFSAYKAVQFKLVFSATNDKVEFFVRDISNTVARVQIVANGTGELPFRYEFASFDGVNFNAIKELGLNATTEFITGDHSIAIKDIIFVE